MSKNTFLFLGLGIGAYFFLSSRTPVFAKAPDGSYQPAGLLDRLTVALTGKQPPLPQQISLNIPGVIDASYTA